MTIDALQWLDQQIHGALALSPTNTSYVYGIDSDYDGPCALDYDPWEHAELLDVSIVTRDHLPNPRMVACYSKKRRAIFLLPGLPTAIERCAIAHEIVHHEYGDIGTTKSQENRADRIAARRLIRPSRIEQLRHETDDLAHIALELNVTERIMRAYVRDRN